jgi:hypothetical protein
MFLRVVWYKFTDVLEVLAGSIIRATALMMEAVNTSQMPVYFYWNTRRNNPETGVSRLEEIIIGK